MNLGLVPLAVAALGFAYAGLVLRSTTGASRRDNLTFGVLALADSCMTAWRGINVATGLSIVDPRVLLPCAIGTIALAVLTIEFIAGFPRRAPMPWSCRCPLLAWATGAAIFAIVGEGGGDYHRTEWLFFGPATTLVFVLGGLAWRRTRDRDARTVIAMLWFRWALGFVAYAIGPAIGAFDVLVWLETTVGALISFVVIGTAVLRGELFSIRSSAGEAVTIAAIAFATVLGGGAAIWFVETRIDPGRVQQACFVAATLVPLAIAAIGYMMYPRVERRVLANLDERRARRLGIQGEPLPPDASAAIAEAERRISQIADGARVTWLGAAALPEDVRGKLAAGAPLRRDEESDLPACLIVPALGAERAVSGAFYVDGGTVDRDTYVVARDLAQRVALVVERMQAVTALEDARRLAALGQFAAAIAHDIRTPLTSISLNVQILRSKLTLPPDDREHFDIALEELARLDRSVAEILDFAKPVRLTQEPIDIAELLESTSRGLVPVLSEKGVALRVDGKQALVVQGDRQRLRQVLVNLVDNAADASQPGAEVTVTACATEDRRVAIEIADHGRGIGADDLARIFEPFFTTRPDGTGLGLAICHKVVRAHGGDIRVRSAVGEGSTFTVTLPAA